MKPESKDHFFLGHILQAIDKIERLTEGLSYNAFLDDWKTQDAVVRNLEIIGEAASNISEDLKQSHMEASWQDAKNMRNFLIHAYFSIDYQIVWNTIQHDLPKFKEQVAACLDDLDSNSNI